MDQRKRWQRKKASDTNATLRITRRQDERCGKCYCFFVPQNQPVAGKVTGFCYKMKRSTRENKVCKQFNAMDAVITEQFKIKRKLDLT